MELFEDNKKKALALKAEIDKTDKEIDQMVYELYGLTEEEIKIVEGGGNFPLEGPDSYREREVTQLLYLIIIILIVYPYPQ